MVMNPYLQAQHVARVARVLLHVEKLGMKQVDSTL
jgi:hypothetical protein